MEEKLASLKNNGGFTLKKGVEVSYKTGYQVATEGIAARSVGSALKAIESYGGDCGVWKCNGIYYIDKSKRVATKREALRLGRECNQLSILKWSDMSLIWC